MEREKIDTSYSKNLYNHISTEYADSKLLPFRWVETFSFMKLFEENLLNLSNKEPLTVIFDIACGDGYYTRKMYEMAPNRIYIGIDISEDMIKLANQKNPCPSNIHFLVYDALNLDHQEFQNQLKKIIQNKSIEMIVCCYFFNYAKSIMELMNYIKSIKSLCLNSTSSCKLIGVNDNYCNSFSWYGKGLFKSLGYEKIFLNNEEIIERKEGQGVIHRLFNFDQSIAPIEIINYWLDPDKVIKCFDHYGFKNFKWIKLKQLENLDQVCNQGSGFDHIKFTPNTMKIALQDFVKLSPLTLFQCVLY